MPTTRGCSGACPARVPPRAAGLQAALAGAARRVTRPRPGGGGAGGRGGGGRQGGAKRALNFLSAPAGAPHVSWSPPPTGLNLSHKLSFALSWRPLHRGGLHGTQAHEIPAPYRVS